MAAMPMNTLRPTATRLGGSPDGVSTGIEVIVKVVRALPCTTTAEAVVGELPRTCAATPRHWFCLLTKDVGDFKSDEIRNHWFLPAGFAVPISVVESDDPFTSTIPARRNALQIYLAQATELNSPSVDRSALPMTDNLALRSDQRKHPRHYEPSGR
jgi:hypothetical protein